MLASGGPSRLGAGTLGKTAGTSARRSALPSGCPPIDGMSISADSTAVTARGAQYLAAAAVHSSLHSRSAIGLPPSIPLTPLSSGRLRLRALNTESHTSANTPTPPPPIPQADLKNVAESARPQLASQQPLGTQPPTPPLPVDAIPPKIVDVAAEKVEKELAAKKEEKPKGTAISRAWATVKKEASHYWHGTKLLGQEIKISAKLQYKVLQGATLTRRERRQVSSCLRPGLPPTDHLSCEGQQPTCFVSFRSCLSSSSRSWSSSCLSLSSCSPTCFPLLSKESSLRYVGD